MGKTPRKKSKEPHHSEDSNSASWIPHYPSMIPSKTALAFNFAPKKITRNSKPMKEKFLTTGILFAILLKSLQLHAGIFSSHADSESSFLMTNNPTYSLDNDRQRRWAAEASLTFHIVRIYMMKFSYKYSDRVELGIGPAFQNWKNEDESFIGQANAYTLLLSYRYYFWRNFNVEIELWPA